MLRRAALLAVLSLMLVTGRAQAEGLELTDTKQLDPRLQELTFSTDALPGPAHVRVLLPDGYNPKRRGRYPVLYLLHGGGGNAADWTTQGEAEQATAGRKLIVVMPDAGTGGWYTDWAEPGTMGQPRWETFHIRQLLPWIDAHFPTRARRSGRAIAGLSMGGFGAMSYAGRHPDLFAAASAWSGAVDTNTPPLVAAHVIDAISSTDGGQPGSLFGLREKDEVNWRAHNPWDLAENLRGMTLALHTGDGNAGGDFGGGPADVFETAVHPMNVSFHERLGALGIDHVFDDYGPGAHTWPYWNRDLREDLPGIMRTFRQRPAAPKVVSYRAVEPNYKAFGWSVELRREELEFSHLTDATRRGFTLIGSGKSTVLTPARYKPGRAFNVAVNGGTTQIRADDRGRLRVPVDLGASNGVQEFQLVGPRLSETERVTISR